MSRFFILTASVAGALAVALGAIGAHELKDLLAADRFDVFLTGVRYLAIHAVILFVTGWFALDRPHKLLTASGILFIAGMVLFSGSLVVLAVSSYRFLGAVAPVGGVSYILGWLLLGLGAVKATK
jgi:uncharacterized membrane protein YgdD (TMEM256/DUF423 family)